MNLVTIKKKLQKTIIPEEIRAAGVIPVLAYSEDDYAFLMDDKSIGFGFLCQPLNSATEKVQERTVGMLNQEFPAKSTMQFTLFRSPDITQDLYRMIELRDGYQHDLLSSVIRERTEFLKHHTREKIVAHNERGYYDSGLIQDTKLFVTVKVPIKDSKPTSSELSELQDLRSKVESSLQTVGLRPLPMTAVNYIRIMGTMLNWGDDASWKSNTSSWDTDRPICEQVFDYGTDITMTKNSLQLGDQHVKVLSAKKLPDLAYFGDAITYIGDISGGNSNIKENYMIVTNIFFPDPENMKSTLDRKRQFAVNQAYGPMLKFVPVLADKKEGFDVLYDSMKEGQKPISISYSMIIFAPTKERADAAAMSARNIWRETRFDLMEDRFVLLPMLINNLPLCTDRESVKDLFRHKTMTTEQAAVLLPIFGEWKGTGTYHASLLSRNGQLMSLSLHDSNTNKNLVIAAESGSGKSFLTNELIFSYLSEGAQVWVIDAGKSYQKLSDLLKGDFVHFEEGTGVCLNPFELVQNYEDEEDAIVSLVSAMASAKGNLSEWQVSALKQVMTDVWEEKGQKMKVDDIADRCLEEHQDQRLKDVGMQLYPFTSRGSYGKYFAHDNNVSFQNQFTVLELDELQGRKHLRQVVLLQLIYQIQQEVFLGERNRKKVVIVDEAWDLLKEGEVSVFMEHAYRKFRKYGGSVVIATQSINDLYENAVGRAIAENSASMYLLGQTEETVESVKRSGRLTLSEGGFNILKTVHTVQGIYSEIFIKSKTGMGVGRLIVGDFQKLLYSTDPGDVDAIDQYVKRGLSIPDSIRAVMQDRARA
ncbi:type IV conjugative transfer system protein TraC [Alcanivorax nanhaiticus]|mgnify:CR=1 FL=1|uniref:Type IV conjugative transfer system protein TraC n=1 Tax=Alcanivorax nanhaiticus TaxID=1177154 RepID=A0A095UGV0_9GAMM|nr:type IV secretion system protein TraC [Alcanivorax nanhaiticus]KGD61710.1 type IV conjugative transfer system protein TraC [Alcanivorax nanhaiticus]MAG53702.1 type-IV secretion system protein TraC [Halomonas sp.]OUW29552.1 MAG: type-IV secretion system protein TraC [Rhodospirillaceae bacterium TMED167]